MHKITIVGLGTCENEITLKALEEINSSKQKVVRTSLTQSAKTLQKYTTNFISLDTLYEKSRNFDTLNNNLAKSVISLAKKGEVVYFVDGSAVEDNSAKIIVKKCKNVEIVSGISYGAKCLERLKIFGVSYTTMSAYDLLTYENLPSSLVVYALTDKTVAGQVKLRLMEEFGEEIKVYFTDNNKVKEIYLYDLDRQKSYDYSTAIYIKPLNFLQKTSYTFEDLIEITRGLRSENGCPWDKVQTFESIRKNLIEECYELIDAINNKDSDNIIEEIGDVLLQAVFYIVLGEESELYTKKDCLNGICQKLISRHTHVFGKDNALSSEDALDVWNKNKQVEKGYDSGSDYIKSVPSVLPALLRTQKVTSRASKYNFDFPSVDSAIDKIFEEIEEIKSVIGDLEQVTKECGDLIFSVVNVCRLLGVDSETALISSLNKFINRFTKLESAIISRGKDIKQMSISEIDEIYTQIKGDE